MFQAWDITFEPGTILTAKMLQELRDYPREILSIQYGLYPDGILAGTDLRVSEDGRVWISKGLVKYDGVIYRMAEDQCLSENVKGMVDGGDTYRKLLFVPDVAEDVEGRPSQKCRTLRLQVVGAGDEKEVGIEFARFKLSPTTGEISLFNRQDKSPAGATFWNMTYCPYARRGEATYHPYVFKVLRPVLEEASEGESWRYTVLERLSTEGVLSMELIRTILRERGMLPELDNVSKEEQRAIVLEQLSSLKRRSAPSGTSRSTPAESRGRGTEVGKMLPY